MPSQQKEDDSNPLMNKKKSTSVDKNNDEVVSSNSIMSFKSGLDISRLSPKKTKTSIKLNRNVLTFTSTKQPGRMKSELNENDAKTSCSFKMENENLVPSSKIKKFKTHHNSTITQQAKMSELRD